MPFRKGNGDMEALTQGTAQKATPSGKLDVVAGPFWCSLLPLTFNTLWAGFINMQADQDLSYFAMQHDDIIPEKGWLDTLIEELEATGADMISAVVPIKDQFGLTSTAVDSTGDEWNPRRLTIREVFKLPETFGKAEVGGPILLNTGLWVCRFDAAWCQKFRDNLTCFRQQDQLRIDADGKLSPHTKPEDWDFSRQFRALGGKLMATRKVKLIHERPPYRNYGEPWGECETDPLLEPAKAA